MNIQLRDSKTLQEALMKKHGRNALPKAQLHPELLNGIVDIDSGGFVIRTEINKGEHSGDLNAIDAWNMEQFLPEPAACTASWTFSGGGESRVASELVFSFDDRRKLVIRTQAAADVTKLTSAIPSDRSGRFDASYDGGSIIFARSSHQPESLGVTKSTPQLRVEAAKAGVKWDPKASAETMVERIEQAKVKPQTVKA